MENYAFIDYRLEASIYDKLRDLNISPIKSETVNVSKALEGHGDLQIFPIDNKIFTHSNISLEKIEELKKTGKEIVVCKDSLGPNYPLDVPFNIVATKNFAICNIKTISREILSYLEESSRIIVDVRQGYVRCSCLPLPFDGIITNDEGIHKKASLNDIKSLHLKEKIFLKGFDTGFLGGTSGTRLINDVLEIYTMGAFHSEVTIRNFIEDNYNTRVKFINLREFKELIDIGSILFI